MLEKRDIINEWPLIVFQTMKILIVYQSVIDMCAAFFTLLHKIVQEQESNIRISHKSVYDLWFFCRFWQGRLPLWCFLDFSTYGILLTACDRYAAVIYPIWYNNNVSPAVLVTAIGRPTYVGIASISLPWPPPIKCIAIVPTYRPNLIFHSYISLTPTLIFTVSTSAKFVSSFDSTCLCAALILKRSKISKI